MASCIFGLLALSNAHLNTLKLCKTQDSLSRMWPIFQLHGSVRIRPNVCLTGSVPCCVQRGARASYLLLTNPLHFWHVTNLTWPSEVVEQLKQSREKIPQYQHHCLFCFFPLAASAPGNKQNILNSMATKHRQMKATSQQGVFSVVRLFYGKSQIHLPSLHIFKLLFFLRFGKQDSTNL